MSVRDLEQLRKKIDAVDQQLIGLLHQRMQLVKEVGLFKKEHNITPLDPMRWQIVLESKKEMAAALGLDQSLVHDIYQRIHQAALEMEEKI